MTNKTKVLILGKTGMLGMMVYDYFINHTGYKVAGTERMDIKNPYYFDSADFLSNETKYAFLKNFDYIINCIGIIKPHCKDNDPEGVLRAIQINAYFPHKLSRFLVGSKTRILQIATDCVYSGKTGHYDESAEHDPLDVYGKTKSLGEVQADNLLNIRCSIIGPELKNKLSLLEWFLTQKDGAQLTGFENHEWNGVTTLQFAKICHEIIKKNAYDELRKTSPVHHFTPNSTVSKHKLLEIFKEVFGKNVNISKGVAKVAINRTISTKYNILNKLQPLTEMKDAIAELGDYMKNMKAFSN